MRDTPFSCDCSYKASPRMSGKMGALSQLMAMSGKLPKCFAVDHLLILRLELWFVVCAFYLEANE
jgi:hypothetical protein